MDRLKLFSIAAIGGAMLAAVSAARANDSAAELSIGGLQFVRTNDIAMESEDLRISLDRVTGALSVRQHLRKTRHADGRLPAARHRPLGSGKHRASLDRSGQFRRFRNRESTAFRRKFQIDQRAMVGDRDVSALLDQFKLPLLPIGTREIRVADLPAATRTKLVDQGLLMPVRTDDKGRQQYAMAWVAKTSAVRQQTFPPGRKIVVEHQYKPSVGTSTDTYPAIEPPPQQSPHPRSRTISKAILHLRRVPGATRQGCGQRRA